MYIKVCQNGFQWDILKESDSFVYFCIGLDTYKNYHIIISDVNNCDYHGVHDFFLNTQYMSLIYKIYTYYTYIFLFWISLTKVLYIIPSFFSWIWLDWWRMTIVHLYTVSFLFLCMVHVFYFVKLLRSNCSRVHVLKFQTY